MLFGKKKDSLPPAPVEPEPTAPHGKKGRPTPTRKEAEAANRRPLVPGARAGNAKEQRRKQRELEYQALQGGDQRYLPAKDKGPVRAYIREWIDRRRTVSEFFLLIALAGMVFMFISTRVPMFAIYSVFVLYGTFVAVIIENIVLTRKLKKDLIAKFGEDAIVRGTLMYMVSRATQLRRLRLPKPIIGPGGRPPAVKTKR